ncbi:30S ribosomal protein S1 [compost metagenome]
MVLNIDRKARGIQLSIKAKDNVETQEAMQKMAATDNNAASGTTSLGALLKAKFDNKN